MAPAAEIYPHQTTGAFSQRQGVEREQARSLFQGQAQVTVSRSPPHFLFAWEMEEAAPARCRHVVLGTSGEAAEAAGEAAEVLDSDRSRQEAAQVPDQEAAR